MYLAAYTSPVSGKAGYRWIWRHPVLSEALCMACYTHIEKPADVAFWSSHHFNAGFFRYDQNWLVVYRILDAGRDSLGRLGRFFLIVGLIRREEVLPFSLERLLKSPPFSTVSEEVRVKSDLEIEIEGTVYTKQLTNLYIANAISGEFYNWGKIDQVAIDCMNLGGGRPFHLKIEGKEHNIRGQLTANGLSREPVSDQVPVSPFQETSSRPRSPTSGAKPSRGVRSVMLRSSTLVLVFWIVVAILAYDILSRRFLKANAPGRDPVKVSPVDKKPQKMQPPKEFPGPHSSPAPSKLS